MFYCVVKSLISFIMYLMYYVLYYAYVSSLLISLSVNRFGYDDANNFYIAVIMMMV